MKGVRWVAAGIGLLLLGQSGTGLSAETLKVGVVYQKEVIEKTKAGKRALDGLKEFQASRQRIINADDEELKKLENELKQQESGLSEEQRRQKQELFRAKFENYQRRLQEFNREIQQKQKALADEFQKKIDAAAQAVAERGGYAAVLDKGDEASLKIVLYHHPAVDLTAQVIKEFDRRNK